MTLKEKFNTMVLDKDIADWEKVCEKIADDYAIEFAKWCRFNMHIFESSNLKYKQKLEIFKKEKGL